MAFLLSLPNELLFQIIYSLYALDANFHQHGSKGDLLSTRLACRRLAGLVEQDTERMFQHYKFLVDDEGFRRLHWLAQSPLCRHVRVISCCFQVYSIEDSTTDIKGCPSTFENLLGLTATGLADTLGQFQNLQAIRISQRWKSSWFWDLEFNKPIALSANPFACRLLENVVHALAFATSSITELTLSSDRPYCPNWPLSILTQETQNLYRQTFGSIKRLKVVLPKIASDTVGEYGLNIRGLKALIKASPQLEELHLSIDMIFSEEPFQLDIAIPKLQHLVLDGLKFEDISILLNFLERHLGTLKSVEIRRLDLVVTPPNTVDVPSTQTTNINGPNLDEDSLVLDGDQLQQIQQFRNKIRRYHTDNQKYKLCAGVRDNLLNQHTSDFLFTAYHYVIKVKCTDYETWKARDNTRSNDG